MQKSPTFNRASVNVSGVHYHQRPKYPIDSATALSVILHPANPFAPSMHFHISYIEPRGRSAYWRMIADLNPSHCGECPAAAGYPKQFEQRLCQDVPALKVIIVRILPGTIHICTSFRADDDPLVRAQADPKLFADAQDFGDRYFWICPLGRHRGASHLFIAKLDEPAEKSPAACQQLASDLAETAIASYISLVQDAMDRHPPASLTAADKLAQLEYHTVCTPLTSYGCLIWLFASHM